MFRVLEGGGGWGAGRGADGTQGGTPIGQGRLGAVENRLVAGTGFRAGCRACTDSWGEVAALTVLEEAVCHRWQRMLREGRENIAGCTGLSKSTMNARNSVFTPVMMPTSTPSPKP